MATLDIGACVQAGFDGFKKDPISHIIAVLLVCAISGLSSHILSGPMLVGYMKMLKNAETTGKVEIADVFKGFDSFIAAFLAVFISSIIVVFGFMLCIIPGLLIMALPTVAAYLVADGETDGIKAMSAAFDAVKANLIPSCLCVLILGIIGSLGVLLCGVGILVTLPIAFIGEYHMAKQMVGSDPLKLNA